MLVDADTPFVDSMQYFSKNGIYRASFQKAVHTCLPPL